TESTRYSLRVANEAGDQSRAATVFVDDIEIDAFEAFPPIVGPDETFELAWTYTATFDPEFEIATLNPGNVDVSAETADPSEETRTAAGPITADTTYSLTVDTNHPVEADRQTIAAATTGVQYSTEPILDRFAVTPQMVCRTPGGTLVDLDWLVYAASSIRLDGGPFANAAVAREGTDTALVNDSTTFTLTATNALGVARSA